MTLDDLAKEFEKFRDDSRQRMDELQEEIDELKSQVELLESRDKSPQ